MAALLVGLTVVLLVAPTDASAAESGGTRTRVIVVFNASVSDPGAEAEDISRRNDGRLELVYRYAIKGFAASFPEASLDGIAHDPRVDYIEPDRIVQATAELPTGVDRIEADKDPVAAIGGNGGDVNVDIAGLDTGIDGSHPDLNVVGGVNCTSGGPLNTSCSAYTPTDGNGHGTHTAGTMAARDNGIGVVGVAPGARLWAVKVLNNAGSGYTSWIMGGIDWVTANASTIEVGNMSFGGYFNDSGMNTAITNATNAGVVFAAAAGNDGADASGFSPANHSRVIAVSAMSDYDGKAGGLAAKTCRQDSGNDDTFTTWSNYGSVVDLAGPGVCINSTAPGGGYQVMSGTSMASPHVAGAAALYIAEKGISRSSSRWSTVMSGLQTSWAVPQSDPCGFTGGKSSERFLQIASCGGAPANTAPSVTISSPANGATFDSGATITFTGTASDTQDGNLTSSLTWTSDKDGSIGGGGSFSTTLSNGTHVITASVTDTNGAAGSAQVTITVNAPSPPPSGTMSVSSIAYSTTAGKNHDKNLNVTVTVVDGNGNAVAGATVSITLQLNGGNYATGTGTTGSTGAVTFALRNAPSGTYHTVVDTVSASGLTWDGLTPANSFVKP